MFCPKWKSHLNKPNQANDNKMANQNSPWFSSEWTRMRTGLSCWKLYSDPAKTFWNKANLQKEMNHVFASTRTSFGTDFHKTQESEVELKDTG